MASRKKGSWLLSQPAAFNAWEERRVRPKVFNRDPIVVAIVQFNGCNGRSHGLPNVVLRVVKASLPKCHETNQGPRGSSSVGSLQPLK